MQITLKTLANYVIKIEADPNETVKDLKEKIHKDHADYEVVNQKLIYSGKILSDDSKISELNIDEKKFVVLMITKPPPVPKPQTATASTTSNISETIKPTTTKPEESKSPDSKSNTTEKDAKAAPANQALPAATNQQQSNPTLTATTTNTTPATIASTIPSPNRAINQPAQASGLAGNFGIHDSPMAARLAALTSQPRFTQIQTLMQQSPHLISSAIDSLANTDPELYRLVSENPDVFVQALNSPPMARAQAGHPPHQQGANEPTMRSGTGRPPAANQVVVNVSDRDMQAIERLKELGFPEFLAVQVYMACDKDEQLAANLLLQMDQ